MVVPLGVYVLLTHAVVLFGRTEPLSGAAYSGSMVYQMLASWHGGNASAVVWLSALLVFVQAILVNWLVDSFRLLDDRNWVAASTYVLLTAAIPDFLYFSAPLFAVLFLLVAFRRLFQLYKAIFRAGILVDIGFWLACFWLIFPPGLPLFLAGIGGVNGIFPVRFKGIMQFFTGVITVGVLAGVGFFLTGKLDVFWEDLLFFRRLLPEVEVNFGMREWLALVFEALLILTVAFSYFVYTNKKGILTQKCVGVLFWFLGMGLLAIVAFPKFYWGSLMVIQPVLAIFLAMNFQRIKRWQFAEAVHLVLILWVAGIQYFDFLRPFFQI
jgi:hypothetical protein